MSDGPTRSEIPTTDADPTPRVAVIVLNWNGWRDTVRCLDSLQHLEYPNREVIVVDNGSTDGSPERIREVFSDIEIIRTGSNLGYAGGNNAGLRRALDMGAEFVWLLNNDTKVHRRALDAMVSMARASPRTGAVGSVLRWMSEPERVQYWGGGRLFLPIGYAWAVRKPARRVDWLCGASLLIRCSALRQVGLLDDGFFMYWEDVDFALRLRRFGWSLSVAPDACVWHKGFGSLQTGGMHLERYYTQSAMRLLCRHAPFPLLPIFISTSVRLLKRGLRGQWRRCAIVWETAIRGCPSTE